MSNKKNPYIAIVRDGAIANPDICDGKLIPVLILDCENHQEFLNLVCVHQNTLPGDVISSWGYSLINKRYVTLKLIFLKPVELEIRIKFDLQIQSAIADIIVQSKAVYLQPSDFGAKVSDGIDKPKIIIEIPPKTKLKNWDSMLISQITKKLRNDGISKKYAENIAKQHLEKMREFAFRRFS